jgi:Carboxypeptidase regulatory-like domain
MRPGWSQSRMILLMLLVGAPAYAQPGISGKVLDETGVAVAGAHIELHSKASREAATAVSDTAGNFTLQLPSLPANKTGEFNIRASRQGFFLYSGTVSLSRENGHLTITLNHLQEFAESIDVTYSPPAIDLQEPADKKQLDNVEILTVPYPAPQDLRNALPLMNGVVLDPAGRVHVNGGASEQTNYLLDGFHVSDPATGRLEARLNIETVRTLDLDGSRFTAEKGKGSAGSLDIQTKMGDNRWRFGGTNFFPGISTTGGLHVDRLSPRLEVSGPLVKDRAWFHNGLDFIYSLDTVSGLPRGQNRASGVTVNNLSRFQVNLTPANILTGSLLVNHSNTNRNGLSFLDPLETTTRRRQNLYMYTLKDQMYFTGGTLLELGFADTRTVLQQIPQGNSLFEITPFGQRGNYFVNLDRHAQRDEWLANLFLPSFQSLGHHQLKFGVDLERDAFHQEVLRHDYEVLRTDLSTSRYVTFAGSPFQRQDNFDVSQYLLDRWTPREGLLIEAGLRADWNEIARDVLWSPRLSFAYGPKWLRDTKIAGGYGIFYDALVLQTLAQQQDQISYSTFFLPGGQPAGLPVQTAFLVNQHGLTVPRYRTASLSVDRKLPLDFYARAAYTHKEGTQGFAFVNDMQTAGGPIPEGGIYRLDNGRHDVYRAMELSIRRTFAGQFEWFAGFTRSSARANAVVDYSLESPIFAPQGPGPYAWDTPNRFLTWGWAPVPKRLLPHWLGFAVNETSVAFLMEYHTGFPFNVVNEEGVLVGTPNSARFPSYINLNLHFERKFRFLHYLWAWRIGFNNITNSGNPNVVNNNIDSPAYLTYGRGQLRAFAVRLRFLGKR